MQVYLNHLFISTTFRIITSGKNLCLFSTFRPDQWSFLKIDLVIWGCTLPTVCNITVIYFPKIRQLSLTNTVLFSNNSNKGFKHEVSHPSPTLQSVWVGLGGEAILEQDHTVKPRRKQAYNRALIKYPCPPLVEAAQNKALTTHIDNFILQVQRYVINFRLSPTMVCNYCQVKAALP